MNLLGKGNITVLITLLITALSFGKLSSQMMTKNSLTANNNYPNQSPTINNTIQSLDNPVHNNITSNILSKNLQNDIVANNPLENFDLHLNYINSNSNRKKTDKIREIKRKLLNKRTRIKRQTLKTSVNTRQNQECKKYDIVSEIKNIIANYEYVKNHFENRDALFDNEDFKNKHLESDIMYILNLIETSKCELWKECIRSIPMVINLMEIINVNRFTFTHQQNNPLIGTAQENENIEFIEELVQTTIFAVLSRSITCGAITDKAFVKSNYSKGSTCNPLINYAIKYLAKFNDFNPDKASGTEIYLYDPDPEDISTEFTEKCEAINDIGEHYKKMANDTLNHLKNVIEGLKRSPSIANDLQFIVNIWNELNEKLLTDPRCDLLYYLSKKCCGFQSLLYDLIKTTTLTIDSLQEIDKINRTTWIEDDIFDFDSFIEASQDLLYKYIMSMNECINGSSEEFFIKKLNASGDIELITDERIPTSLYPTTELTIITTDKRLAQNHNNSQVTISSIDSVIPNITTSTARGIVAVTVPEIAENIYTNPNVIQLITNPLTEAPNNNSGEIVHVNTENPQTVEQILKDPSLISAVNASINSEITSQNISSNDSNSLDPTKTPVEANSIPNSSGSFVNSFSMLNYIICALLIMTLINNGV